MDCLHLTGNKAKWETLVNKAMNFLVRDFWLPYWLSSSQEWIFSKVVVI